MARLFILALPLAQAVVFDAYFASAQAKLNASWAREEAVVSGKLKALEERFKKKPNIIYILADACRIIVIIIFVICLLLLLLLLLFLY